MYTALYRKWRPLTFDDVVSQPHITTTLRNQIINGKTAHAYLFTGSRGTVDSWVRKFLWRSDWLPTPVVLGFPGGSDGKESACNAADLDFIPGLGRSLGGGHSNPLQYACLENPHGQRSLVGYSPWGCKESDTTERLSTAQQHTI